MKLDQLLTQSELKIEPIITVFQCDQLECRIVIDVIHPTFSPSLEDFSFAAILSLSSDLEDRLLILNSIRDHARLFTLNFTPCLSGILRDRIDKGLSCGEDLFIHHKSEYTSPYPQEINERLTQIINNAFSENLFEITFI